MENYGRQNPRRMRKFWQKCKLLWLKPFTLNDPHWTYTGYQTSQVPFAEPFFFTKLVGSPMLTKGWCGVTKEKTWVALHRQIWAVWTSEDGRYRKWGEYVEYVSFPYDLQDRPVDVSSPLCGVRCLVMHICLRIQLLPLLVLWLWWHEQSALSASSIILWIGSQLHFIHIS